MAFSGHKTYGPNGHRALAGTAQSAHNFSTPCAWAVTWSSGVEYDRAGHADLPTRLEGGTPNVSGAVGLAAAASFISQIGRSPHRCPHSRPCARRPWRACRRWTRHHRAGAPGPIRRHWCRLLCTDVHPHDIGTLLDERGIAVRTGHHCANHCTTTWGEGQPPAPHSPCTTPQQKCSRLIDGIAHALKVLR